MKNRSNLDEPDNPQIRSFEEHRRKALKMEHDARPLSEVLRESIRHVEEIVRSEVRLAKIEITEIVSSAAKRSVTAVVALVLSLYALNFLFWGGAYALSQVVPLWLSAVIVGVVLGILAAAAGLKARRDLRRFHPKMEKTTQTMKENLAWIKNRTP